MTSNLDDSVLFMVPGDPQQRTGGYRYVGQLVSAINQAGRKARVQGLEGRFPIPDAVAESAMDSALANCEDGACVVLDGLAMGGLPAVVEKHAARLRLVALVHHPLADETGISDQDRAFLFDSEKRALAAVSHVITTSRATADRLKDFHVPPEAVQVIEPGADTIAIRPKTARQLAESGELQILCVASLSPRKAQHQLVQALAALQHLRWHCTFVGSTDRNREYSQQVAGQIQNLSLDERISMVGELGDEALAEQYQSADLFVLPSVYEGYGMVIDEALAAGLPVVTTNGGALASTGKRPGVRQYPAGSVDDLRDCLETCLSNTSILQEMTSAAGKSSESARQWSDAAEQFKQVMGYHQTTKDHSQFERQWLALREPADHRARNRTVLGHLQDWARQWLDHTAGSGSEAEPKALRVADLGAGAGSNGAYLSDRLAVPQHWTLLDQNPTFLAEAVSRLAPEFTGVDACQCAMEVGNLNQLIPGQTRLITASALIDLASAPWLDALADTAAARRAAVYIVLSYAGEFQLSPEHPDDDLLRALVNDHQHGDKGSGAALGPEATGYLEKQLKSQGFVVVVGPSPWMLGGDDRRLQAELITGWCEAALEQNPAARLAIENWQASRLKLAEQGSLTVQVAHHDLFAWPAHD